MLARVGLPSLIAVSASAIFLHLMLFALNTMGTVLFKLGGTGTASSVDAIRRAIVLVTSQKTLPVCVCVIGLLGPLYGEAGLIIVPCIIGHLLQIVIDSVIVSSWVDQDRKQKIQ